MWEVEGLYYPCSENKGADQLRLCFRICKKPVFSRRGSYADCGKVFAVAYLSVNMYNKPGFDMEVVF